MTIMKYTEIVKEFYNKLLDLGYEFPNIKYDGNSYWCESQLYMEICWQQRNGLI